MRSTYCRLADIHRLPRTGMLRHQHGSDEQPAHAMNTLIELGRRSVSDNASGEGAEERVASGVDDDRRGAAANHVGPHEAEVWQIQRIAA